MSKAFPILWRGLVVTALAGAMALGGSRAAHAADTDWTIKLPNWNPTTPWIVEETYAHGQISGTVLPPNPHCAGTVSGTWNTTTGALKMTFTYKGTCLGETSILTGSQSKVANHGTATDALIGVKSRFSGKATPSSAAPAGGAACGSTAAC